ncbi:MAG: GntR family transcriptional regulator [Desulfobacteraceae bacterium]|nr:MAG: GntR family transcriptional regulator [Desulfobacteraceae bacterium]
MSNSEKKDSVLGQIGLDPLESLPLRRSLGQHIFSYLKEAIIKGDIAPGNRLVENRLAKLLGISRTPVREAFHKLEREGFIKLTLQGGYAVTGLTREEIEDIFGIRSLLESYAARLAAIRHEGDDLLPLKEKIEEFRECLDRHQLRDLTKINTEFHDILYTLSKRPKLIEMINNLRDQIYRFRRIILSEEKYAEISHKTHRKLFTALKKRDADRVENLMREHILDGQRIVLNALENKKGEF